MVLHKRRNFATAPIKLVVLVVGATPRFLERFRIASAPRKAEILETPVASARAVATARIPRTILVPASVYATEKGELEALAEELCARIVKVDSEELSEPELDDLVQDAVKWA